MAALDKRLTALEARSVRKVRAEDMSDAELSAVLGVPLAATDAELVEFITPKSPDAKNGDPPT